MIATAKKIVPSISTLSVNLKVIQINNKQMTFGVFRQLYEGVIYDSENNLMHELWGKVNYKDETWIVYQVGDVLMKMSIDKIDRGVHTFAGYLQYEKITERFHSLKYLIGYKNSGLYYEKSSVSRSYDRWVCCGEKREVRGPVLEELFRRDVSPDTVKEIEQEWYRVKQIGEKGKKLYEKCEALDQLFIAV